MNIAVTGASSGVGKEVAIALARRGHSLVLAARREPELLEVGKLCMEAGAPMVIPVPCDVCHDDQVQRLALALGSLPSGPCGLVVAAGLALFGPTEDVELDHFSEQMDVLFYGAVRTTKACLPLLQNEGYIVHISSIAAEFDFSGAAAYGAAKAGASKFFQNVRKEFRPDLRITDVILGATATDIWDRAGFRPEENDMISPETVGFIVAQLFSNPSDVSVDRIDLLPRKGLL